MTTPTRPAGGLNAAVAGEIRAELARRQWSQVELASKLGVDQMWLSRRLRAVKPLTLTELEAIAEVFGVEPAELLGRASNLTRRSNFVYTAPPVRPPAGRPKGRGEDRATVRRTTQPRTTARRTAVPADRRSKLKRELTPEELSVIAA